MWAISYSPRSGSDLIRLQWILAGGYNALSLSETGQSPGQTMCYWRSNVASRTCLITTPPPYQHRAWLEPKCKWKTWEHTYAELPANKQGETKGTPCKKLHFLMWQPASKPCRMQTRRPLRSASETPHKTAPHKDCTFPQPSLRRSTGHLKIRTKNNNGDDDNK